MKFKSNYGNKRPIKGEDYTGIPSETIQGESYTIKELLAKQISGTLPPIERKFEYNGENWDFTLTPQFKQDFDLTDLDEARAKAEYILKVMKTNEENSREAKKIEEAKALLKGLEEKEKELKKEEEEETPENDDQQIDNQ